MDDITKMLINKTYIPSDILILKEFAKNNQGNSMIDNLKAMKEWVIIDMGSPKLLHDKIVSCFKVPIHQIVIPSVINEINDPEHNAIFCTSFIVNVFSDFITYHIDDHNVIKISVSPTVNDSDYPGCGIWTANYPVDLAIMIRSITITVAGVMLNCRSKGYLISKRVLPIKVEQEAMHMREFKNKIVSLMVENADCVSAIKEVIKDVTVSLHPDLSNHNDSAESSSECLYKKKSRHV